MVILGRFIGLAIVSISVIGIVFLGSVPQATAETLNYKGFDHVTKGEMVPITDVPGHFSGVVVREGVTVFEDGEWAWRKAILINDTVRGAGTTDQYLTITFLDGSTITFHNKGTIEATPAGVPSAAKFTGDIIGGTGRFQGAKGTTTISAKILPPEKGETGGKALPEGTIIYTLPGK